MSSFTANVYCPGNITTKADPFSENATVIWPYVGAGLTTTPPNGSEFEQGISMVVVDDREDECSFFVSVEGIILSRELE